MHKLALVSVLIAATPAFADDSQGVAPPTRSFGVDGAAVLPVGDYSQGVNFAVGALARIEIPAGTGFFTGRAGALFHFVKEGSANLTFIPIYAGYRFPLAPNGFYLAGELGLTIAYASAMTGFGTVSDSETKLGVTLGAGMKSGRLDLRGSLFLPDINDDNRLTGFMGTVGYDFSSF